MDKIKTIAGKDIFSAFADGMETLKQIFGQFLYENEIGVLFGDSNTGKSILANDIAFYNAGGGIQIISDTEPLCAPVMYIDMEMSDKQFVNRYKGAKDYITESYFRTTVDTSELNTNTLLPAIKSSIVEMYNTPKFPKLVIIDNITSGFGSIYSAKQMVDFIKEMKILKERYKTTFLLIAHCPKRKEGKPITQNDLGGSKMIINFVDSAFALANSLYDPDLKYIKQIKTRVAEKMSDVMTVKIEQEPYPHFVYVDNVDESLHLKKNEDPLQYLTPEQEAQITRCLDAGVLYSHISSALGIPIKTIRQFAIQYYNQ